MNRLRVWLSQMEGTRPPTYQQTEGIDVDNAWWWLIWIAVIGIVVLMVIRASSRSFERSRYRSRGVAGRRTAAAAMREGEPDEPIREEVSRRPITAGELDGSGIVVRAQRGRLTLRGTVPSSSQRDEAARIACGVAGVRVVENRLQVGR